MKQVTNKISYSILVDKIFTHLHQKQIQYNKSNYICIITHLHNEDKFSICGLSVTNVNLTHFHATTCAST